MMINDVIRAEIPDPELEPELYKLVTEKMIHGPCGEHTPNAPCMREKNGIKKYRFNFPHEFHEKTELKEDGHVNYRRRNNGRKVIKTINSIVAIGSYGSGSPPCPSTLLARTPPVATSLTSPAWLRPRHSKAVHRLHLSLLIVGTWTISPGRSLEK